MRKAISRMISEQLSQRKVSWMNTTEAIEKLNMAGMRMSLPTLIKLIRTEQLEGKKVGVRYFVTTEAIETLLK
jgi:hypothetical protein